MPPGTASGSVITWRLLVSPRGRIGRSTFWTILAGGVIGIAVGTIIGGGRLMAGVALAVTLLSLYVCVINMIKRLHDRNKSGHWVWLFLFAPLIGPLALYGLVNYLQVPPAIAGPSKSIVAIMSTCILIWGIVEMGFLPGTKGPNGFGPDPRASTAPESAGGPTGT